MLPSWLQVIMVLWAACAIVMLLMYMWYIGDVTDYADRHREVQVRWLPIYGGGALAMLLSPLIMACVLVAAIWMLSCLLRGRPVRGVHIGTWPPGRRGAGT